jgi:dGTPase
MSYPDFPGLNLTFEVRESLRKHERPYKFPTPTGEEYDCPSLEGQVADLADEITYYSHDLDDAVDFEILSATQLEENEVWRRSHHAVLARYAGTREPELHKLIIRDIIDNEVHDVVATSAKSVADAGVQSADDVRWQAVPLIRYSGELAEANRALRKFLYQNVYYHPRVSEVNRRACEMLRRVFEAYLLDPDRLGDGATRRIESEGLHRTVCDYVAGMTDRYLIEEYKRIAGCSRPAVARRC